MSVAGPRHAGHGGQAMDAAGTLPGAGAAGTLPIPGEPAGGPADPAAAQDPAGADGRLVGGRYRLAAAIGQGGMGRVWHARDEFLGRDVAVKEIRLPPGLSEAEQGRLRQRTLREARGAARLSHPAVATVHDVVEDLGRPWIVMELVRGRSLDRVIADDGPLPPQAAARVGRQLLAALAAAHAAGVLHRDVKPGNVMLAGDGKAVLTDFGLATIDGDPSLTQAGTVVGTPAFAAPERIRGETATPASDLWSLGATLYAAVEGKGPYDHCGGVIATIAAIAAGDPPPPETAGPLSAAITALLTRDPAARPTAAAAMRMLEEAADAPAGPPGRQPPGPAPRRARRTRRTRRTRRAAVAALACLAVTLPVCVWALQHTAAPRTAAMPRSLPANPAAPSSPARPGKPIRRTAARVSAPAKVHVPPDRPSSSSSPSTVSPRSSVDLALHRPVTATSYAQVYQPANATDGSTSTYWEGAQGVFPQSVTVDLGSVTDIARIVLALPPLADWNSRVQTLALYGSRTSATSAFTIVPAARYTFNAATNDDEVTISFAPTDTRYVTVYFTANSGWPAAQLAEILIYA